VRTAIVAQIALSALLLGGCSPSDKPGSRSSSQAEQSAGTVPPLVTAEKVIANCVSAGFIREVKAMPGAVVVLAGRNVAMMTDGDRVMMAAALAILGRDSANTFNVVMCDSSRRVSGAFRTDSSQTAAFLEAKMRSIGTADNVALMEQAMQQGLQEGYWTSADYCNDPAIVMVRPKLMRLDEGMVNTALEIVGNLGMLKASASGDVILVEAQTKHLIGVREKGELFLHNKKGRAQ